MSANKGNNANETIEITISDIPIIIWVRFVCPTLDNAIIQTSIISYRFGLKILLANASENERCC